MKILSLLFNRLNVLNIHFELDGSTTYTLSSCFLKKGKFESESSITISDLNTEKEKIARNPLLLTVSGKGIVSRDISMERIVDTVVSNPETFMWTIISDKITFIRREQSAEISTELERIGVYPLYTECISDSEKYSPLKIVERYLSEYLKWKIILKPEGSQLALLAAKRLVLPVLGMLLLILSANFIVSARVTQNYQTVSSELAALIKTSSVAVQSSEKRQAALEQFSHSRPFRTSRLSDCIAAVIPQEITLKEFLIAPLTRVLEAGKPVVQNEKTVIICGETYCSEAVTLLAGALAKLELGAVQLSVLQHDNKSGILKFKIEIIL